MDTNRNNNSALSDFGCLLGEKVGYTYINKIAAGTEHCVTFPLAVASSTTVCFPYLEDCVVQAMSRFENSDPRTKLESYLLKYCMYSHN